MATLAELNQSVNNLTNTTTDLLDEVNVKKTTLTESAETATLKANAASDSADTASQKAVQTTDDATQTAADRVATGQDAASTSADRTATAGDAAQTAEDRVATEGDASQTAADRLAASSSATEAGNYADSAATASLTYGTVAAGINATTSGQMFRVTTSPLAETVDLYRNDSGVATLIQTFYTRSYFDRVERVKKANESATLSSDFTRNEHKVYEQYGLEPKTITQMYDVTRNGVATYWDATGILRTAGIDEPRINFDPETGENLGLLVEESRTNEILYSIDPLERGDFGASNMTLDTTPVDTPFSDDPKACVFREVEGDVFQTVGRVWGTMPEGLNAASVSVKDYGVRYVSFGADSNNGNATIVVDLANGQIKTESSPSFFFNFKVKKESNGFCRVSFYIDTTSFGPRRATIRSASNYNGETRWNANESTPGDPSRGFAVIGYQRESGHKYSTSLIVTQDTQVTRPQDDAFVPFSTVPFDTNRGGTYYTEFVITQTSVSSASTGVLTGGTTSNRCVVAAQDGGLTLVIRGESGSTAINSSQNLGLSVGDRVVLSMKIDMQKESVKVFALGQEQISLDGSEILDVRFADRHTLTSTGSGAENRPHTRRTLLYTPVLLSDEECAELTKP